jgi:hypothetical protein
MINCGGKFDVSSKLAEINSEGRKVKVLLIDSHRPFHHTNLFENKNIWIVDDGTFDKVSCPTEEEIQIVEEEIDLDDDNKDEISEEEDEIDGKNIMEKIKQFRKQINGNEDEPREVEPETSQQNGHNEQKKDEVIEVQENDDKHEQSNNAPNEVGNQNKPHSYMQEEEEEVEIGKKRIRRRIIEKRERRRQQENIRQVNRNQNREVLQRFLLRQASLWTALHSLSAAKQRRQCRPLALGSWPDRPIPLLQNYIEDIQLAVSGIAKGSHSFKLGPARKSLQGRWRVRLRFLRRPQEVWRYYL